MRVTLSGAAAPELAPARVVGLPFETLPLHLSGITVDLDIRRGDFVEVLDQETGEVDFAMVLYDFSSRTFVVKTLHGQVYRCAALSVGVRVQLTGTRLDSRTGIPPVSEERHGVSG